MSSPGARQACDWVDRHLDLFNPWRDGEISLEGLQSLGELAVAYTHLVSGTEAWDELGLPRDGTARWRDHILRQLESPQLAELPRKRPSQSFPYLLPYLVFRSTGWRNRYFEETLDLLYAWGFPDAFEAIPFRQLDVQYFYAKSGYVDKTPNLHAAYEHTFLAKMRNLVQIDEDAAYSITHTLFYLSDFGASPLSLPEPEIGRIRKVVESLLVHYWRLGHWDLVGELLICSRIVGSPEPTLAAQVARAFDEARAPDGGVLGSQEAENELDQARKEGDRGRLFSGYYHTTIVSLLYDAVRRLVH